MQRRSLIVAALAVLLAPLLPFGGTDARADDKNVEMMKKLFTRLLRGLSLDTSSPAAGETFLVVANPGVLVDPTLDLTKPDQRRILQRTLDRAPKASWYFQENPYSVDVVYNRIRDDRQLPKPPALSQWEQDELSAAEKVLYEDGGGGEREPTKQVMSYTKKQTEWATAMTTLQDAEFKKHTYGTPIPAKLYTDVTEAEEAWATVGYRWEVEGARETFNAYSRRLPANYFANLKRLYDTNSEVLGATRFPRTTTIPAWATVYGSTGWTKLTLTEADLEMIATSSHTSYGGGLSAGFGLWRIGASGSHSSTDTFKSSEVKNLVIDLEVKRVFIDRPWMDFGLLESKLWAWGRNSSWKNVVVSDGGNPATGRMPLVPTALLVARNVKLTADWGLDIEKFHKDVTSGGASVGWGPFQVSGSYYNENTSAYKKATFNGNTVTVSEPQIIGWFCQVLQKSPDPDLSLEWPESANYDDLIPQLLIRRQSRQRQ